MSEQEKAPHTIKINTGDDSAAPAPAPEQAAQNGAQRPVEGPGIGSPWMVELNTVERLIEAENRRTALVCGIAVGIALLALAVSLRAASGVARLAGELAEGAGS